MTVYRYKYTPEEVKSKRLLSLALFLAMAALELSIGTYSCGAMKEFAQFLAWLVYLIPFVFALIGLFVLRNTDSEITPSQYKRGIVRLNNSGMAVLLFSLFSFFCDVYYIYSAEYESLSTEIGLLVRLGLLLLVSACFALLQKKQRENVIEQTV